MSAATSTSLPTSMVGFPLWPSPLLTVQRCRPGWVFTRTQIVDAIHGESYAVTDRAGDVQIVGLRKKLGSCGEYIETVRGIGYRFRE